MNIMRMLIVAADSVGSGIHAEHCVTIWGFWENFGLVDHVAAYYIAVL